MKNTRSLVLVGSVAIGLWASAGAAAAAQDGAVVPAGFTAGLLCADEAPTFAGEGDEEEVAPGLTVMTLPTPTWSMTIVEPTDPRLAGEATFALNGVTYWDGPSVGEAADPSLADVMVGTLRIQDADGAWEGTTYLLSLLNEEQFASDVVVLTGSGAYDGLVAVTEMRQGENICAWDLKGAIVAGGLPEAPAVAD